MLKATGVVRKVDSLGRIVIPMEIRQAYDIKEKDSLEIFVDDGKIVLRKYEPACIFCNNAENITNYQGKLICKDCVSDINKKYA
ncbi:MAG TPA: AbrB/MazE/SpoVT family DNA-binding domain-containing protein [Syntrophomonadaceae bacterium]|nr:AbrB/MazE/SpoVT family DNA-binding domain-containing protein [Syntrophomonadaceae bacterium]HPR94627.1 AbrB/MazE/SpoVT family DNA-binding domain-containing protein [Syntrophomonadaceae bacterium]